MDCACRKHAPPHSWRTLALILGLTASVAMLSGCGVLDLPAGWTPWAIGIALAAIAARVIYLIDRRPRRTPPGAP